MRYCSSSSLRQLGLEKCPGFLRLRAAKELLDGSALYKSAIAQEKNFIREPARLSEVVRRHHDFCPGRMNRHDDRFDFARRSRIEIRGRFIEKKHFRANCPCSRQREPLLLTAREHTRRLLRLRFEPHSFENVMRAQSALARAEACEFQCVRHIRHSRSAQHDGALKHHRLTPPSTARGAPHHLARRRLQQTVTYAHQHAFACAIRTEYHCAWTRLDFGGDGVEYARATHRIRDVLQTERQHRGVNRSAALRAP
jgi:hypothetical protein